MIEHSLEEKSVMEKHSLKNKEVREHILNTSKIKRLKLEEAKLLKHSVKNIIKDRAFNFLTISVSASEQYINNPELEYSTSLYLNTYTLKKSSQADFYLLNDEKINESTLLNIIAGELLIFKNKIIVNAKQLPFVEILNQKHISYGIETSSLEDFFEFKNSMIEFDKTH